jgi:hypothetical protein
MRVAFVLLSYAVVVGLGLASLVKTKVVHAWSDQALISVKTATDLETPVELKFDEVPLQMAVERLCHQAEIDVVWDASCYNAEAPLAEETVALSTGQPLALRRALALILEPCYLTWELQADRQLRIFSREQKQWDEEIVTVNYDVRQVLKAQPADFDLPGTIQKTVSPHSWQSDVTSTGGYMLLVDGELQVTQRRSAQVQVAALLAKLASEEIEE